MLLQRPAILKAHDFSLHAKCLAVFLERDLNSRTVKNAGIVASRDELIEER